MDAGSPRTGFEIGTVPVPPLALGTMYFGTRVAPETALACLDAAAGIGATFLDTANNYAFWAGGTGDESETVLGDWFASRGSAARDSVVLATKVGARPRPGHADLQHVQGLSARAVRDQVTGSLGRLQTDRLDVLYAHTDDASVDLEETVGVLNDLIREGLVREIGASNLTTERLLAADQIAVEHRYRVLQQRFTYLPAAPDVDTAPQVVLDHRTQQVASAAGMTVVGYSPLLSGAYTRANRSVPAEYDTPRTAERLAVLHAVVEDQAGSSPPVDAGQVVLAWMVRRADRVLPVVGVSSPAQVVAAWTGVQHELPDDAIERLDSARS